jgi:hypothetical protein
MSQILHILRQSDESDKFLTFGILALFFGLNLICPPAAYSVVGCIFLYIAHILATPAKNPPMEAH